MKDESLSDRSKLQLDMLEMADRRTRFALLILGTLNALNVLVVAPPDLYWGLMILVFMTAGMLALVVVRMLLGSPTA